MHVICTILNCVCRSAVHLGMTEDIPFLERPDWMGSDGKPKFKVYCPVTAAERSKRLTASERRRSKSSEREIDEDTGKTSIRSALELQFDWPLHQMTGYMRRLDGAGGLTRKNNRCMDPLAADGLPKHAVDGSRTPFFGYWFYVAWYNVINPVLARTFGQVLNVRDKDDLDTLLGATVMM